jgi:hypothetical protein
MSALNDVLHYLQRGWAVIPVPFRSKNPGFKGWERLRISSESIGQYFNGEPQNVGVLLGEPSAWLVNVYLDHMRAVQLAPQFLPATPAILGRPRRTLKFRCCWPFWRRRAFMAKLKSGSMLVVTSILTVVLASSMQARRSGKMSIACSAAFCAGNLATTASRSSASMRSPPAAPPEMLLADHRRLPNSF